MRKARFKAALALAQLTMTEWCAQQGIAYGHLYQVLNGLRESKSLIARVDAFTDERIPASAA